MVLQMIPYEFSICKVEDINGEILRQEYIFTASTDSELSLICRTSAVPQNVTIVENGWKCFRIAEDAAFEKYGMIAFLTKIIADQKTGVLVIATYDTDYLLVKEEKFQEVSNALTENGCQFI